MMPACPIVPNQRQGNDGTVLGNDSATVCVQSHPGSEAALPGGPSRRPNWLNLGPVSEHSCGKFALLVGPYAGS
jgi:hypothetical protein